ncbi:MAG: hypothetical protein K6C69_05305 [Lachnospiraceae bacterium]|nr:hypothetical protein [Lachnospiraceae bacterium]
MDQKQLIDAMEEIRHLAENSQGMIKKTQVLSILKKHDFIMDESQMDFVYAYLKTAKVSVLEEDHTEVIVDAKSIERFRTKAEEAEEAEDTEDTEDTQAVKEATESTDESENTKLLSYYMEEVKGLPVYVGEDLVEKLREYYRGNLSNLSEEVLFQSFFQDVIHWVKNYEDSQLPLMDMIQEGNMAFMNAIRNREGKEILSGENPLRKYKNFIRKIVLTRIQDSIFGEEGEQNVGYKVMGRVNAVNDAACSLSQDYGRKVTPLEVAEAMDLTEEEVLEVIKLSGDKIDYIHHEPLI